MAGLYDVIFAGALRPGVGREEARQKLGELYGFSAVKAEALFFSGPVRFLRSGTQEQALALVGRLAQAGIECQVVEAGARPDYEIAFEAPAPAGVTAAPAGPAMPPTLPPDTTADMHSRPFFDPGHVKWLFLSVTGRVNRLRYWYGNIIIACAAVVGSVVLDLLVDETIGDIFVALLIYPSIALCVKRAHDRNRSGHFLWLLLVPIASLWPVFELSLFKGTAGPNKYGADPRAWPATPRPPGLHQHHLPGGGGPARERHQGGTVPGQRHAYHRLGVHQR